MLELLFVNFPYFVLCVLYDSIYLKIRGTWLAESVVFKEFYFLFVTGDQWRTYMDGVKKTLCRQTGW